MNIRWIQQKLGGTAAGAQACVQATAPRASQRAAVPGGSCNGMPQKTAWREGITMRSKLQAPGCGADRAQAFSLMELLVVMAIIGLLATLGVPALKGLGGSNKIAAANRQLLDDIGLARARAISGRTTVYMVFVPPNTMDFARSQNSALTPAQRKIVTNLSAGPYTMYALLAARTPGDQPGRSYPRYLTDWRRLPDGIFITTNKFVFKDPTIPKEMADWVRMHKESPTNCPFAYYKTANGLGLPFPTVNSPRWFLPYIAFNASGQLVRPTHAGSDTMDEYIPLSRGSIMVTRDAQGEAVLDRIDVRETPPGNSTITPNRIHIDWLTGRARVEKAEFR